LTTGVVVGATALFFAIARTWASRTGDTLTLRDPAMWLLAVVATLEATFGRGHYLASAVILALGSVCALTDKQTGYIYNAVLLCATALLIPCVLATGDMEASVLGAAVCGAAMLFLHVATRGRGLGLGDVKLAAAIGAGLTLPAGLVALGAAFVAGALAMLATALVRRARVSGTIAFAPYLALGSMLSVAIAEFR
jgi:leader peptidase (prepilin peptidase) / N-methyltransferase